MREIKFRVFSKENGFMYDWKELLQMDSFKDHMMHAAAEDRYYSPLMQFTGLHDKNGVEIYEGDVLSVDGREHPATRYQIVTFEDGMFGTNECSLRDLVLFNKVEVVNNIYEQ